MMDEQIRKKFTKLEGAIMVNQVPRIENRAPLALFYKQAKNGQVLYTNVQEEQIRSFVADNYDQMHQNTAFELFYVLDGTMINRIEDKEFVYTAGQGCLLNRRITHSDIVKNGHLLVLNVSAGLLEELLTPLENTAECQGTIFQFFLANLKGEDDWRRSYIEFSPAPHQNKQVFQTLLDALQMELATKKIGAQYLQRGLLLRLLTELENPKVFELNPVNIDLSKEDYLVSRLVSLIELRNGDISRKEIEQNLHYNAEYLNRILKKRSGRTITAYAKNIRINKAKELLKHTRLKIIEISENLGFSSENYFYHYFKEETGMSPNHYRKEKKSRKT